MAIGAKGLAAFKAKGSPPMPMPEEQPPADEGKPPASVPQVTGEELEAVATAAAQIEAGEGDPELAEMMAGYDGDGAPPWAADLELWTHAVQVIDPDQTSERGQAFGEQHPEVDPWLAVAQLYSNLGGEIAQGDSMGEPTDEAPLGEVEEEGFPAE